MHLFFPPTKGGLLNQSFCLLSGTSFDLSDELLKANHGSVILRGYKYISKICFRARCSHCWYVVSYFTIATRKKVIQGLGVSYKEILSNRVKNEPQFKPEH